jgi:hypothetical protein
MCNDRGLKEPVAVTGVSVGFTIVGLLASSFKATDKAMARERVVSDCRKERLLFFRMHI